MPGGRSNISWVYYRTTQLREDLKVANEIKEWKVKQPALIKIWKDFQEELVEKLR